MLLTMTTLSPFHERLVEAAGKISYRRLGKLTDTHPETVRRYMHGKMPSAIYVQAFCDALGVSGDWLLTGRGTRLRTDVRTHALKQADASELLNAIAETLTLLTSRVDTMERFMQSLETRLGPVLRSMKHEGTPVSGILQETGSESIEPGMEPDERFNEQPGDLQADNAIERIRGVVAQRASAPAD
jgi:transcriptional regulator with XRE-family HTH domain